MAYLCGSISFAIVVSKLSGLEDPRTFGSHNPGATNVLRTGNKWAALATLLLDGFKGWMPLVLAKTYVLQNPFISMAEQAHLSEYSVWASCAPWVIAGVALSAFAGHLWPVFFEFKGGKGVATAAGLLLGMHPLLGVITLLTWISSALLTRYSSLSALIAAVLAPVYLIFGADYFWSQGASLGVYASQSTGSSLEGDLRIESLISRAPWPLVIASSCMAVMLIYRHRENIKRLLSGEESKIFASKKVAPKGN
jgi:glycerol-3-phosphate acyltransferase PlsY